MSIDENLWDAYTASGCPSEELLGQLVDDPSKSTADHPELYPMATVLGIGNSEESEVSARLEAVLEHVRFVQGKAAEALKEAMGAAGSGVSRDDVEALLGGQSPSEFPSAGSTAGWLASISTYYLDSMGVPASVFDQWSSPLVEEFFPVVENEVLGEPLSVEEVWVELVDSGRLKIHVEGDSEQAAILAAHPQEILRYFEKRGPELVGQLVEVFRLGELGLGDFEKLQITLSGDSFTTLVLSEMGGKITGASLDGKPLDLGQMPGPNRKKARVNAGIEARVNGKRHQTTLMI